MTSVTSHDVDASVSDTGSRGNLPDNQSDSGHVDEPQETAGDASKDTKSGTGSVSAATAARKAPGSTPNADDTK